MVPEDHTRFVSPKLFELPSSWEEGSGVEEIKTGPSNEKRGIQEFTHSTPSPSSREEGNTEGRKFPTEFNGIPYSSIVAEFWRRTGGEPPIGKRNTRLHQLAANLRAICDNNEEWLLEVMPRFELKEQEMRSIIHSACKEPTKGSRLMEQIVSALEMGIGSDELEDAEAAQAETGVKVNVRQ